MSHARSSKRSTKKIAEHAGVPDGPFAAPIAKRARELSQQYTILVEVNEEGGYTARAVEMPTAFANDPSEARALKKIRDVLEMLVATLLEQEIEPPVPASEKRSEQLNVRLTSSERIRIESAAKRQGFRGVSDFVRAAALDRSA